MAGKFVWIETLGFQTLSARLLKVILTAPLALAEALKAEADAILEETLPYVPYNTGALRDSGMVQDPVVRPSSVVVDITFGNDEVDYAVPVHEDTTAQHTPPTKAKFLEDVVLERAPQMQARMAVTTAAVLKI
jgi:hypothetical protein